MVSWWKEAEDRAMAKANPVNPQRVTWELSPRMPERAIITSDSGSCANWFARDLKMRRGQMCSLSGGLASMGAAVPYAIAAKVAHPDRPVIALVGDGAMQMNNMAELITVSKYMQRWSNKTWICCVFNNEDLNQVTWEQRVMEGNPKFEASQTIPNVPYHKFAELIGLKGIYVDDPQKMGAAWDEALASPVPVVLEVKTDPEVPPLPPFFTFQQVQNFMSMLGKGDRRSAISSSTPPGRCSAPSFPATRNRMEGATAPSAKPMANQATITAVRARSFTSPRRAGSRRHLRVGEDDDRRRPCRGRRSDWPRLQLHRRERRSLIGETLASVLEGGDVFDIPRLNAALWGAVRNLGRSGLAASAISGPRHGLVGPEGTPPRPASGAAVRSRPRHGRDLRQRRFHLVRRPATERAARGMGRAGRLSGGQDENR